MISRVGFNMALHNRDQRTLHKYKLKDHFAQQHCTVCMLHVQHLFSNPDLWADSNLTN